MEKYLKVMKMSQELIRTIIEGNNHIQKLVGEGKFEQTIFLFEDVLEAFSVIERSLDPIMIEISLNSLRVQMDAIKESLTLIVSAYEEKSYGRVREIIQFTLGPQFKKLEYELEEAFKPYMLS